MLDPYRLTFKEVDGNGDIDLEPGEMLRISCPGNNNNIVTALGTSDAIVECHAGAIFIYVERHYSFYELGCRSVNYLYIIYAEIIPIILRCLQVQSNIEEMIGFAMDGQIIG